MSSRIEIELTSEIDADLYTWRALGAKEPKGTIIKSLLPTDVSIGDTFRVEADFLIDGIEIIRVLPKREERKEQETIEILGSGDEKYGVTTQLVKKKKPKRNKRATKDKRQTENRNSDRRRKNTQDNRSDNRKVRPARSPQTGKRLKAKRSHRKQVIAALPELHKPLAREILSKGIPNLRKTLKKMQLPEGFDAEILQYAEKVNIDLKSAEWRDRADAVLASIDDLDLRDFRSVVAAGGQWARTDELLILKGDLEEALRERIDREHQKWLLEIEKAIKDDKCVRALNLSSHPPKPGTPLPESLTTSLVQLANTALASDVTPHRWSVVVQAVAFSPVRLKVTPLGIPKRPTEGLISTVKQVADRIPHIAKLFDITVSDKAT